MWQGLLIFVAIILLSACNSDKLEISNSLFEFTEKTERTLGAIPNIDLKIPQHKNASRETMQAWLYDSLHLTFNSNANDLRGILPSQSLKHRKTTCVGTIWLAALYAEKNNLPIHFILMPGHIYLQFFEGDSVINFEPNRQGFAYTELEYQKKYPDFIKQSYYQKPLSNTQLQAVIWYAIGTSLLQENKITKALTFLEMSHSNFLEFMEAGINYASALNALGKPKQALEVLQNFNNPEVDQRIQELKGE